MFDVTTQNFFFFLEDFVLQMKCLEALRFFPPNLHHQLQTLAWRYMFYSKMALFTALTETDFPFPHILWGYLGEIFLGK